MRKTTGFGKENKRGRRKFITNVSKAAAGVLLLTPQLANAGTLWGKKNVTVGDVMDQFINEVPNAPFEKTVDTLKAGNRDIVVTGIVTTMFATIEVIRQAIALKANFIIAHEPTFYNHADESAWLENDAVYQFKMDLLKKNNIAVWRNHDYIHSHRPDGVKDAVVKNLGWTSQYNADTNVAVLPAISLRQLISHVKTQLGINTTRYIGDLSQSCSKILLLPGAAGGRSQIQAIAKAKPDVLICGEIQEWETAEYVRDARATGDKLSLVVLGHIASEEPGSHYMAEWLKQKIPAVKTTHIPAKNSLEFL